MFYARARSKLVIVLLSVLLTHGLLLVVLSMINQASYQPTSSIQLLESFVLTENVGQSVAQAPSDSERTTPAVEEQQVEEVLPESFSHEPLMAPTPEDERNEPDLIATAAPAPEEKKEVPPEPKPVKPIVPNNKSAKPNTNPVVPVTPSKSTNPTAQSAAGAAASNTPGSSDITPPISNAAYLNNPHPPYPRQSRRLGEQGQVILSVHIDTDGTAVDALIKQTSGYPRLDEIALQTVKKWRFIPGKKAGSPQKMWVNIPINFILE